MGDRSCGQRQFYFTFNLDDFRLLSFPIALTVSINTMSNRIGKNKHFYPVSDFKGKALSLSPLSVILAVNFKKYHLCDCGVLFYF